MDTFSDNQGDSLYTIDFVAKLDKEIYHGDMFESDNFDSIEGVRNLPQLV